MANPLNTTTVDGKTYARDEYTTATKTIADKNKDYISKDTFLQLMVKQMQFQDPLDPMDNSEYLSQLAQFSALEQMTNVASGLENLTTMVENIDTSVLVGQLSNMIDKAVQWAATDENGKTTTHTGVIKGVSISDGAPSLICEVTAADGTKATTKVEISNLTRIGEGLK